jgi:hypothetical protein
LLLQTQTPLTKALPYSQPKLHTHTYDEIFVGDLPVDKMTVDKMTVDKLPVDEMTVGKMSRFLRALEKF